MGIPEYDAKKYQGQMMAGGILIAVRCEASEQVQRAKQVLQDGGAQDIVVSPEPFDATTSAA